MASARAAKSRSPLGSRWVALLRGVNVGGKNKLPMRVLVDLLERRGCTSISTYIQSGNVVFSASSTLAKRLASELSAALARELRLEVPVLVRSATELRAARDENPFIRRAEPAQLHLAFLAAVPQPANASKLDPQRSPGDRFELRGRHLYLLLPNGVGKSKLTNDYFDRTLATTSTVRNWRTVEKLIELCGESGQ